MGYSVYKIGVTFIAN